METKRAQCKSTADRNKPEITAPGYVVIHISIPHNEKKNYLKLSTVTHIHIQKKVTTVYSNMFISLSLKNEFFSGRRDGRLFPRLVNKCLFYGHNSFLEVQYAVCQTFSASLSSRTLINRGIKDFIPNSLMPAHEFKKHGTLQPPRHPRVFLRHFKYALD